ncbi:MAG: glycosyltransferase family 39 protein [Bacteroidota bacterium]
MWNIHKPFRFLVISVFCAIVVTVLLRQGMFMDGLMYSSISRNLADGKGSMWFLHFSNSLFSDFHEHPPLVFWIQAVFFKLFGDGFYTERLYCLLAGIAVAWLITRTWKELNKGNTDAQPFSWLPVLFWISIPVISWGLGNNMLENTMAIFTTAAVLVIIKGISQEKNRLLFFTIAALMIFFAVLAKGPVAMFPLAAVFMHWIVYRRFSFIKALMYSLYITGIFILVFSLLFAINHQAWLSMNLYLEQQIIKAYNDSGTVSSRFFILPRLFRELGIGIALLIMILLPSVIRRRKAAGLNRQNLKKSLFLTLVGLSASLPLMVSMKQSGFYVIPAYPWFALAFAFLCLTQIQQMFSKLPQKGNALKIMNIAGILLLTSVLAYNITQINKPGRDTEKLNDIRTIADIVPRNSTVSISQEVWPDWALHGYFERYYNISLDAGSVPHEYYLALRDDATKPAKQYSSMQLNLKLFKLYANDSLQKMTKQ